MAISDEEKVDLLWKKFIYGVSKTETPGNKSPSNETRPSPIVALGNEIWINAKDIPTVPPAATTSFVQVKTNDGDGTTPLTMITDSSDAKAWRAFDGDSNPLEDWIPFSLGSGYALKLWIGDPGTYDPTDPSAIAPVMLFLDGSGSDDEYFFDYKAGILYFIGNNLPVASTTELFIEGYRYIGPKDISVFEGGGSAGCGNEIELCAPTDGDLTDPALTGTILGVEFNKGVAVPLTIASTVTDAIDGLNEVVGLLMPDPPPAFPGSQQLAIESIGIDPRLVEGFANKAGAANTFSAGDSVTRVTSSDFSSQSITSVGSGNSGELYARANPSDIEMVLGAIIFDATDNAGTNNQLTVTDNFWYPSETPGFWQGFDCQLDILSTTLDPGVNELRIDHTGAGNTSCLIVKDPMISNPVIDATTATISSPGATLIWSSGVPHYAKDSTLIFEQLGIANVAGQTYNGSSFFTASVDPANSRGTAANPFNPLAKDYDAFGITTPLSPWVAMEYINPVSVTMNNTNSVKLFQVLLSVTNVNGVGTQSFPKNILYINGQPEGVVLEDFIPVLGIPGASGNGARVKVPLSGGDSDQPDRDTVVGIWDPQEVCDPHEATIVAGELKHDDTNYVLYLPDGGPNPNYATGTRAANTQYATFKFQATGVSNFDIIINGTYSGCYIRMEGVTDGSPGNNDHYSSTGWWNMFLAAENSGIPGDNMALANANGSLGCARSDTVMSGTSGRYNCTFGAANTSDANATGEILVRFKLNPNDKINSIQFTSSTY